MRKRIFEASSKGLSMRDYPTVDAENEIGEGRMMTLNELNMHIQMNEELARDAELLEGLRGKAYSVGSSALNGMPHAPGVSQRTEIFAAEIADLEAHIAALRREIDAQRQTVQVFCETIPDIRLRTAFRLRFLHCLSWKQVADSMGAFYSENGVKTMCYGYLDSI